MWPTIPDLSQKDTCAEHVCVYVSRMESLKMEVLLYAPVGTASHRGFKGCAVFVRAVGLCCKVAELYQTYRQ